MLPYKLMLPYCERTLFFCSRIYYSFVNENKTKNTTNKQVRKSLKHFYGKPCSVKKKYTKFNVSCKIGDM